MAKKKPKTKAAPKRAKAAKKKPASKPRTRKPGPRSQALPGLEQVRHRALDHICESLAEERETANQSAQAQKSLKSSALDYMTRESVPSYKHGGIALMVEPGASRLLVKLTKDDGESADGEQGDLGDVDSDKQPEDLGD